MAGAKVLVGLGNPGREYALTRHNAGWWLIDAVLERWGLGRWRAEKVSAVAGGRVEPFQVRLIKPLGYMNRSGGAVSGLARMKAIDVTKDLLVLVDDVALEPGRIRFRPAGSAGGHNGLKSIEQALGTREYPRLRIGVGACPPGRDLASWVLAAMPKADRDAVLDRIPEMIEGIEVWMKEGMDAAMNRYNR